MASMVHDYASVDAFDDASRRAATRDAYSPVMILLTILSTVGVLYYGWFLLRPMSLRVVNPRPCLVWG